MPACQLFYSSAITYLLVTPGMPFFCIVGTTTGLKRWDNMGAWGMWAINGQDASAFAEFGNTAIFGKWD